MKKIKSNLLFNHLPFIIFLAGFFLLVACLIIKRNAPFYDCD